MRIGNPWQDLEALKLGSISDTEQGVQVVVLTGKDDREFDTDHLRQKTIRPGDKDWAAMAQLAAFVRDKWFTVDHTLTVKGLLSPTRVDQVVFKPVGKQLSVLEQQISWEA